MTLLEERKPIVTVLDEVEIHDESRLAHGWAKIEEKQRQRAVTRQRILAASAAATVTVLLFLGISILRAGSDTEKTTPLALENQPMMPVITVPSHLSRQQQVRLSDGSILTVSPGATLEVIENTGQRFKTALRDGWVRFDVAPKRGRTWLIDAGIVEVRVVGTQFTVNRTPRDVAVRVHRGLVRVQPVPFRGALVDLGAGEYRRWGTKMQPDHSICDAQRSNDNATAMADTQAAPTKSRPKKRSAKPPSRSTPEKMSPLAGMGSSDAVNALLDEIDRMRKQGRHRKAARLLSRLIADFPGDEVVGFAALTLARIRLKKLRAPRAAAEMFRFAGTVKSLPRALREQADARCVEAYRRAGDAEAAQEMSARYKRRYPRGAWLSLVEKWGAGEE